MLADTMLHLVRAVPGGCELLLQVRVQLAAVRGMCVLCAAVTVEMSYSSYESLGEKVSQG